MGELTTEVVQVPFAGTGAGVAELSWGQREMWQAIRAQRTWLPIGYTRPLPPGTTVAAEVAVLRFWMARYPTLRTRLRGPAGAVPEQVLSSTGEVPLELVDGGGDPAAAAAVLRRFWDDEHDLYERWPIRAAVVHRDGVPVHRVVVFCHLVADAFGANLMRADAQRWTVAGPPVGAPAPHPVMSSIEQARWQRSPAGLRQNAAALRHWERLVRSVAARRFPPSADPREPRYWGAELRSTAAALAVRRIAARAGTTVGSSAIVLAAFAVALTRLTGVTPTVARLLVNNRFRPGLAGSVSSLVQPGLFAVDVAGCGWSEALDRTRLATLAAYRSAYHDPFQRDELINRVAAERGEKLHLSVYFNDRRLREPPAPSGPLPEPAGMRAALADTTFDWRFRLDLPTDPLTLHVCAAPDRLDLAIWADTHHLAPADMEACVRGVERVLVEAAAS